MPPSTPAPLSESAEFRAYPDTIPSLGPPEDWADEGDPISARVRAMTADALAPGKLPTFDDDIDGNAIVAALLDDRYDEDRTQTGVQAFRPVSSEPGTEETGEPIDLTEEVFDDDDDKTVA